MTPAAPLGKWQPLLGLVLVETQAFFAKQLPGKCFTEDQLLDMLKEPQLMACPELYGHLNGFLRTLKVRDGASLNWAQQWLSHYVTTVLDCGWPLAAGSCP